MIVRSISLKSWVISHPSGHIYVVVDLPAFLRVHQKTRMDLEKQGWLFRSRTIKPKPPQ
jgi:hypothetical protein